MHIQDTASNHKKIFQKEPEIQIYTRMYVITIPTPTTGPVTSAIPTPTLRPRAHFKVKIRNTPNAISTPLSLTLILSS